MSKTKTYNTLTSKFAEDEKFIEAYKALEIDQFEKQFRIFDASIQHYNKFHVSERRLWSVKIGKGTVDATQEKIFRNEIPNGIKHYKTAFNAIGDCFKTIENSGMIDILNKKMHLLSDCLNDKNHPFSKSFYNYCKEIGCSKQMIEEFDSNFSKHNFDFVKIVGGDLKNVYKILDESVAAQISIMEHTYKDGMNYLKGKCGPPVWAITISSILAAVGILIGAWVVLAIVLSLLILLVIICETVNANWVQNLCRRLSFQLTIFEF